MNKGGSSGIGKSRFSPETRVAAPLVKFDQLPAHVDHGHLHPVRVKGIARDFFGSDDQLLAMAARLQRGIDAQQAQISEPVTAIAHLHATDCRIVLQRDQQALGRVLDDGGESRDVGARALDQIRFVRPAAARGFAAIGALDHRVERRQVFVRGDAYCHDVRHGALCRTPARLWQEAGYWLPATQLLAGRKLSLRP